MTTPSPNPSPLTSLPSLEDLPQVEGGAYEADAVRGAFDAFRRHALQLQAQVRVLQAAGKTTNVDPTGHAVRMDALHLIRAAAEFADALERDAQNASAVRLSRAEEEIRRANPALQHRGPGIARFRTGTTRHAPAGANQPKAERAEVPANP